MCTINFSDIIPTSLLVETKCSEHSFTQSCSGLVPVAGYYKWADVLTDGSEIIQITRVSLEKMDGSEFVWISPFQRSVLSKRHAQTQFITTDTGDDITLLEWERQAVKQDLKWYIQFDVCSRKIIGIEETISLTGIHNDRIFTRAEAQTKRVGQSPQQEIAAENIRRVFSLGTRFAMLVAKCQSGKTGAFHALIRKMLTRDSLDHAYIICGSNETILREQAHQDAELYNPDLVRDGRIHVIFHQDFRKSSLNIKNALIIVDESHLVQTKGQKLHAFLSKYGIFLNGNPENLLKNNTFIVSVDATPFSEYSALTHCEVQFKKHIETLQSGEGYRGIHEFNCEGLLRKTFDIASNPDKLLKLLMSHPNTYILMRVSHTKKTVPDEHSIKQQCDALGIKVYHYTTELTDIALTRKEMIANNFTQNLEDKPDKTAVVLIRGRLRAGKVVPKKYIGAVWEGAKHSKSDTILQGLLGRMCGYHTLSPCIYIPANFFEQNCGKIVSMSELERCESFYTHGVAIPRFATNIQITRLADTPLDGKSQCVPIRIPWPDNLHELFENETLNDRKCAASYVLRANLHIIDASTTLTDAQKKEIRANALSEHDLPAFKLHGRNIGHGQATYFKNVIEGFNTNTAVSENISDCPKLTYLFVLNKIIQKIPGASNRHFYVIAYTRAKGMSEIVCKPSQIPPTNGKSIFGIDTILIPKAVAFAQAVAITPHGVYSPKKFKIYIRNCIKRTLDISPDKTASRIITANGGWGIDCVLYKFISYTNNMVETICRELEFEFHLTNRMIVNYSGKNKHEFIIESIQW